MEAVVVRNIVGCDRVIATATRALGLPFVPSRGTVLGYGPCTVVVGEIAFDSVSQRVIVTAEDDRTLAEIESPATREVVALLSKYVADGWIVIRASSDA
ncbi:MAG TPA: hypothetical protein VEK79_02650 [Thermoanaerobaculia bacterium]|nr:hypothetical protein [Thermoanaerobaculia bacterium]